MAKCLIGLGSNLGDRDAQVRSALESLATLPQTRLLRISPLHATQPAGGPAEQPEYLNACATLETALAPEALLERMQQIENEAGRARRERWGPRTLDLDLLLYDQLQLHSPSLEVPHPRLPVRRFVLEPATAIAPDWIWPTKGWTLAETLAHLRASPHRVAVIGTQAIEKSSIALADPWELEPTSASDCLVRRFRFGVCLAVSQQQRETAQAAQRDPRLCPLLILTSAREDQAVAEIVAAMQASA